MTVTSTGPTVELYEQLALQIGVSIHRLRVTKGSDGSFIPSSNHLLVESTGLRQQSTIYVKDLGMSSCLRRDPELGVGPLLLSRKAPLTSAHNHRASDRMADCLPRGISWSTPHSPVILLLPPLTSTILPAESHIDPRHDPFHQKGARNAFYPPLFSIYHACLQYFPQLRALLATLRR